MDKPFYMTANEVAKEMGVSLALAYKLIREWNLQLKKAGKIVIRGRVNRRYFEKMMEI